MLEHRLDEQALLHPQEPDRSAISQPLQLGLDDLLGDLRYARRSDDLGRLALLCYCEVRRWARMAGYKELAALSSAMITRAPHANREEFLAQVDYLIAELAKAATDSAQLHCRHPVSSFCGLLPVQ